MGKKPLKITHFATDNLRMHDPPLRSRTNHPPGLLALECCGDGFWEFDLLAGSAWFSDWFYRKLPWTSEGKRTLLDLQPLVQPASWEELMRQFRAQLERGQPLDLELQVQLQGERSEWWHLRGAARRNEAGQPLYLAGSVRDVTANHKQAETPSSLLCLRDAFDALPLAAALLDARGVVLRANRKWYEYSERDAARAVARLQGLPRQSSIDVSVNPEPGTDRDGGRLRLRAAPFEYNGLLHLVAMLEDS
jgi:PAS domain-containing protein